MQRSDVFFDTNIIVYFASEHGPRAKQSASLLAANGVVSVQVLNEFANVALGKRKMSVASVRTVLAAVRAVCVVTPMTIEIHELALMITERYKYGIYDASIIAAAQFEGCKTLYSEDMQDGQVIDGLTIRNPYAKG
jgi:predicted nucleic acid-binding protein